MPRPRDWPQKAGSPDPANLPQTVSKRFNRRDLESFLPTPRLVKEFDAMSADVTQVLPQAIGENTEGIDEAQAAADAAQAAADAAQASANAAQSTADTALANAAAAQADVDAVEAGTFIVVGPSAALPNARSLAVDAKAFTLTDGGSGAAMTVGSADLLAILPADVAESAAVFANAPGLSLALVANATYIVEALITAQSAATTTGLALGFTLPAGAAISGMFSHPSGAAGGLNGSYNNASGAVGVSTTGMAATAENVAVMGRWIVKTSDAGIAQMQFRTEIAASAVTLKADLSLIIARRVA